jgi:methionyl-tRNA formyltransferase
MQSIIFLGSKPIGYHCLEHLLQEQKATNTVVVGVLSNDNTLFDASLSVKKLAIENKIPIINSLEDLPNVDILYSVQYHQILKAHHIAKAKRAFNLHMAPLPEYRGCNQFSFAIIDGKKEFGTSIHAMDTKIDHGDIAFEKRFPIPENCWVQDLYTLTEIASKELFIETLPAIINNDIHFTSQESLVASRGTSMHYRKDIHMLKQIDPSWPAAKIDQHIRATSMPGFAPPFYKIGNHIFEFTGKK